MTIEINAPGHPINSVTVFKWQRAEIIRVFPLQLKAGQNKVDIKSLPGTINTDSIRVSGLGPTRLCDVVCLLNPRKRPISTDPSEIVAELRLKKDALQKEKSVLEKERKILSSYADTLTGEHVTPDDMNAFLQSFVKINRDALAAIAALDEDMKNIDKNIQKVDDMASLKKGPNQNGEVMIVIAAEVDTNIDLKLTYIVQGASWEPTYELHASTKDGKPSSTVTLNYRANITQSTGEDWNDALLTLSTSNTSMNTAIPNVPSVKIRPQPQPQPQYKGGFAKFSVAHGAPPPPPPPPQPRGGGLFGSNKKSLVGSSRPNLTLPPASISEFARRTSIVESAEDEEEYDEVGGLDTPGQNAQPASVVKDSALAISYSVQGKSTVPSDGTAHMVNIAELEFDAGVKYVAVPRVEAVVYLQCEVKNTSDYRLLPGSVSVILDDSFVSRTSISDISAGDTFTCTLGVDPATKITYLRKATRSDTKASAFTEAKRTTTYTVKVTVTNKHAFLLQDIVIREVIPMVDTGDDNEDSGISITNKARVVLRKPLGLADAKAGDHLSLDGSKIGSSASSSSATVMRVRWQKAENGQLGGEKDGKFEWFGGLGAGEKAELEAEWEVKMPGDVKWVEVSV